MFLAGMVIRKWKGMISRNAHSIQVLMFSLPRYYLSIRVLTIPLGPQVYRLHFYCRWPVFTRLGFVAGRRIRSTVDSFLYITRAGEINQMTGRACSRGGELLFYSGACLCQ